MTYQELYLQSLESRLNAGGSEKTVDELMTEYNAPTVDGLRAWAMHAPMLFCSVCGVVFKPDIPNLGQEILCETHKNPPH